MIKHVELTMISGAKYFLVSTGEEPIKHRDIDYLISGAGTPTVKVFTESSIDSASVYVNTRMIESYKLFF